jgi:hypothetical protein
MLPFVGVPHVAYLPAERILGLVGDDANTREEFLSLTGRSAR